MFRRQHSAAALVALLASVASVVAFEFWFLYWYSLPDYVWQIAVGAALVAISVGVWTAIRGRRVARFAGVVATALALLVISYAFLIVLTYGPD